MKWYVDRYKRVIPMVVDLVSGLYKAKIRGDIHNSTALKRSVYKFLTYEGAMVVAACIDVLMNFAHFFALVGLEVLDNVAVVTLFIGIFLCVVELMSVREKADAKTHANFQKVEATAAKISDAVLGKVMDAVVESLTQRIKENGFTKERKQGGSSKETSGDAEP